MKLAKILTILLLQFVCLNVYAEQKNKQITVFGVTNKDFLEVIFVLNSKEKPELINLGILNNKEVKIGYGGLNYRATISTKKMYMQYDKLYLPLEYKENKSLSFKYISALAYIGKKEQIITAYSQRKIDIMNIKKEIGDIARKEVILNKPSNSIITNDHINSYILPEQFEVITPIKNSEYYFASYSTMGQAPFISLLVDENKNIIWSETSYDNENFSKYRLATTFDCIGDKSAELILLHMFGEGKNGYTILKFNSKSNVSLIDTYPVMKKYLDIAKTSPNKQITFIK